MKTFLVIALVLGVCNSIVRAETRLTIRHDGYQRTANLYKPSSRSAQLLPLIVVLHGGGGNAEGQAMMDGLGAVATQKGYLVAYPNGAKGNAFPTSFSWNAGECCSPAIEDNTDDVGYIHKLLNSLIANERVDPKRIYFTGISNGAMMAHRFACEAADRVAGVATVAGVGMYPACKRSRPVPLLHIHGTKDKCSPYRGGTSANCFQDYMEALLGISLATPEPLSQPSAKSHIESYIDDYSRLELQRKNAGYPPDCDVYAEDRHSKKQNAERVVFCSLNGGGHAWPGGTYGPACEAGFNTKRCRAFRNSVGPLLSEPDASQLMVKFFENQSPLEPSGPQYEEVKSFSAKTGSKTGEIFVSIEFPRNVAAYRSVVIGRVMGNTPPPPDCKGATQLNIFPNSGRFSDFTPSIYGETYSYRLCVIDIYGNTHSKFTQTAIRSRPRRAPTCTLALSPSRIALGQSVTATLTPSRDVLSSTVSRIGLNKIGSTTVTETPPNAGTYVYVGTVENEVGASSCMNWLEVNPLSQTKSFTCAPNNNCYKSQCTTANCKCACRVPGATKILSMKLKYTMPSPFNYSPLCDSGAAFSFDHTHIIVDQNRCGGRFEVTYQ